MRLKFGEKFLILIAVSALLIFLAAVAGAEESDNLRLDKPVFDGQTVTAVLGPAGNSAEGGGLKGTGAGLAELTAVSLTRNKAVLESSEAVNLGASGGGSFLSNYTSLTVSDGRITGNLASARNGGFAHGGGLGLVQLGQINLTKLEFSGNEAKVDSTGQTTSTAGHSPSAGARGGALSVYNQGVAEPVFVPSKLMIFSVSGSTFSDNKVEAIGQATSSLGGAVAVIGNIDAQFDGSALTGVTFTNNKAVAGPTSGGGAEGGAVAVVGNPFQTLSGDQPPTAVFTKVVFDSNAALSQVTASNFVDARGGAVTLMAINGKTIFRDCLFNGNRLETAATESSLGRGRARGAAIFSGSGLVIENSTFKNNSGTSPGGSLGGALEIGGTQSVIKSSVFEANSAQGGTKELGEKYKGPVAGFGGAIYLNGQLTVADSSLLNNQAVGLTAQGGAVFVGPKAQLTLVDTSLTGNQAIGKEASGGALYVAAGGKLVFGVSDGKIMAVSGNKAGTTSELAKPSGIFLASPDPKEKKPQAETGGRPPRPEPDDLIVNVGQGAELTLSDPVYGEKARITKDGSGILSLTETSLAAWNIQKGALKFLADKQGQGAVIKAAEKMSFAGETSLILEPAAEKPHVLEAAGLDLPKEIKVAMAEGSVFPDKHVILKLSGKIDFKSLVGRNYTGNLTAGGADRNYLLEWNNKGELTFSPGPAI
ncbi:MAG: right-handed parallel beta-helix repeat-containing protein [Deltaproteobacteria bacterium]|jgi:hypothetical protein|nr:right-handed parallel beta-helix repeat-containing protein [Deltaproteobacteria bacterium]